MDPREVASGGSGHAAKSPHEPADPARGSGQVANPWEVVGIHQHATSEEIRSAYLQKVKEHPPDRSPEQFEKIRDAYETLRDPRRRVRHMLLAADPGAVLAPLADGQAPQRRFVGPQPWVEVLRKK